jgi:hypothetical protein
MAATVTHCQQLVDKLRVLSASDDAAKLEQVSHHLRCLINTVAQRIQHRAQAQKTLGQLKIAMTSIPSLFGSPSDSASPAHFAQETQVVLDAFELGAFLSLKVGDMNSFERHIAQVKTIYFDYKLAIPDPKNQALLTGLHLMHLLSQTRIAEFHTALETVAPTLHSHPCILVYLYRPSSHHLATPCPLILPLPVPCVSGAISDGGRVRRPALPTIKYCNTLVRYHKILQSRASMPSPQFQVFLDMLLTTVRDAIAVCIPPRIRCRTSEIKTLNP